MTIGLAQESQGLFHGIGEIKLTLSGNTRRTVHIGEPLAQMGTMSADIHTGFTGVHVEMTPHGIHHTQVRKTRTVTQQKRNILQMLFQQITECVRNLDGFLLYFFPVQTDLRQTRLNTRSHPFRHSVCQLAKSSIFNTFRTQACKHVEGPYSGIFRDPTVVNHRSGKIFVCQRLDECCDRCQGWVFRKNGTFRVTLLKRFHNIASIFQSFSIWTENHWE